jgi:hypothetical protein
MLLEGSRIVKVQEGRIAALLSASSSSVAGQQQQQQVGR